jgi:hypothetical protein
VLLQGIFIRTAMEGGHAGIFSNSMDVAKKCNYIYKRKLWKYFSEKHSMTLIPVIFCAEGNRRE